MDGQKNLENRQESCQPHEKGSLLIWIYNR
jgi:hypothetical protein